MDACLSCLGTPQGEGRHGGVEPHLAGLHRRLQKYPEQADQCMYMYVWQNDKRERGTINPRIWGTIFNCPFRHAVVTFYRP